MSTLVNMADSNNARVIKGKPGKDSRNQGTLTSPLLEEEEEGGNEGDADANCDSSAVDPGDIKEEKTATGLYPTK